MLTEEKARQYLEEQGIVLPNFVVVALVEQVRTIEGCLDEYYSKPTAVLIQLYLLGLLGLGQGDKYISSQAAPSGASQSFHYRGFSERWRSALALLRGLDTHGCAASMIPNDPTQIAHGGIWIGKSGCMVGGR